MNKFIALGVLALMGCGERTATISGLAGGPGAPGSSCHVEQQLGGALLVCDDGTSAVINNGSDGAAGANGADGSNGLDGSNGQDGVGCSVQSVSAGGPAPNGGALITCGATSTLVLNGTNGLDGANGTNGTDGADAPPTAYTIVGVVDPCGDAPGIDDEIFLQLANGQLVWLQVNSASALTARLALGRPGNWTTTDTSSCNFTVHNDLTVTW